MKNLIVLILSIVSIATAYEKIDTSNSRDLDFCNEGGVYLNNSIELAMCWGDNEIYTDWMMERQGFIRVYDMPSSPDAHFYKGGLVFGSDVEFVRALFRGHKLVELYSVLKNISPDVSYTSIAQTYEEFRDYFTYDSSGYSLIKETHVDSVFHPANLGCVGSCGSMEYEGRIISIELYYFMTGKAHEKAYFKDDYSVASISIEVPAWDLVRVDGVDRFAMKWPYFTLCFSEPKGALARLNEKLKRRK